MSGRSYPALVAPVLTLTAVGALAFAFSPGLVLSEAQARPVSTQDSAVVALSEIRVEGNQRIEAETVKAYMTLRPGDKLGPDSVDGSLKSLFATGLFADVSITRSGSALLVKVVENPIINRVVFEGNRRIDEKKLQTELQLRPRHVYTRTKVQEDVKRVLDVYRRSGRFAVTVEPKIIELEQNRVDLVFEVNEGPSTYVQRINFVGNKKYSDDLLKEMIATKEERWYRFLSSSDTYDPDRMNYDRELLRRFYLRQGYSDFRVISSVAELTPDRSGFFMTFTVDEGERYTFGEQKIEIALPDMDAVDLSSVIVGQKGDWYNADYVEETVQALTDAVGALGYAFVDVRPRVKRDRKSRIIDIVYEIQEGPRVYVDRIDISGNMRTLDSVLRREMQLVEGDAFNSARLRRSRDKIRNLGFFEKVEVTNVPSETAPDQTTVKVDVRERSTGSLMFGVGWSSSDGALFNTSLSERNLLGKGQDVRLSLTAAERKQEVELGFTEPYFLDRPLAAGFDVFARERDRQRESSYDIKEMGVGLRLGFDYDEHWRQGLRYTISETEITKVKATASRYLRGARQSGSASRINEGKSVLSMVGQTLSYDRRDNVIEPKEGYIVRLSTDVAGAGGSEKFVRGALDAQQYISVTDDAVLMQQGMIGAVEGLGQDVRFVRNYYLGGDNLRGFKYGGAGPRDKLTGDSFGAKWIAAGTTELRFPLGLPEELGISAKSFVDYGISGEPDGVLASEVNKSSKARVSAGVGLVWKSPMGPVSIDLAQALVKENYDKTEFFRFNFGTRF
ncbi:outer membrane protein assembly factor BamA [Haematospirillum jordaniae]|uniref:outer membrane protein assembly factor BamA n=1 Tax=Haematospirillum jordaniae TaxID=1549855 RepID=UPI0009EDE5E9|nr:outer membrane protein assembly factor BamA [Haematospirillum jordaniae]